MSVSEQWDAPLECLVAPNFAGLEVLRPLLLGDLARGERALGLPARLELQHGALPSRLGKLELPPVILLHLVFIYIKRCFVLWFSPAQARGLADRGVRAGMDGLQTQHWPVCDGRAGLAGWTGLGCAGGLGLCWVWVCGLAGRAVLGVNFI